ncbi:dTDP-glucose 4,6-dehydratase [Paenibacillus senegalimassiliensis]|uniref:dTDP-glucose 4,6-dehydratase n=1 Tax=Paenibacillus senegalimassiliensis TaxID=1737426 RepID=UPI00073F4B5A|nr:GDP-mannose 4,6-dehydratase [Paenibacillus senegalimassiliensis]
MRILLTGGSGFIGTNLTRYLLEKYPDYTLINLSPGRNGIRAKSTEAFADNPNYVYVNGTVENEEELREAFSHGVDVVINLAGQTHVDQSLSSPGELIRANLMITQMVLDMSRQFEVTRLVQISSAEVYGPVGEGSRMDESALISPVNPYAASKAACDLLVASYHHTFGMETLITRCSNNYGPFQTTEKLVPLVITQALCNRTIPMYGDGNFMRDWLHVQDHCTALDAVIHRGKAGQIYNISGNQTSTTREIIEHILELTERPWSLVNSVPDRPGNFHRYSLCCDRMLEDTGWEPRYSLKDGLGETVDWYRNHGHWWLSDQGLAAIR